MFTSWCEWVLRQAKSGPRQGKGTGAACPRHGKGTGAFEPCRGYLIGCHKKWEMCDIFRVDCAIRKDYYKINYAIFSGLIN